MKTVTRSLLLSYSPISSDQLVEFYCKKLVMNKLALIQICNDQVSANFLSIISYVTGFMKTDQIVAFFILRNS